MQAAAASETPRAGAWICAGLGSYALLGGIAALLGWMLDMPQLTAWPGQSISMQPNTALAALCAGAALIGAAPAPARWSARLVPSLGLLSALIGGATLAEHITGLDLGIDTPLLFGRSWGALATTSPGRMGPPASTAFLLMGAGLLLAAAPLGSRRRGAAVALGLAAACLGLPAPLGHLFGADPLYGVPHLTGIALHSATILVALGLGLVGAVPERQPARTLLQHSAGGALARRALPVIVLLPLTLGWLRLKAQQVGLVDTPMGTALLVLLLIVLMCAGLWWSAADVDARARVLASEREARARADMVLSTARDQFLIVEPDWTCSYANERVSEVSGLPREQLLGRSLWEIWPDAVGSPLEETARRVMELREAASLEYHRSSRDRWFHARLSPAADGGMALLVLEISERKRAEQALRESEQRFRLATEAVRGIIYEADLRSGRVERTQGLYEVMGYRVEEVPSTTAWWAAQVHPEDRALIDPRLLERAGSQRTLTHAYRVRHRDGHWLHVEDRAVLLRDEAGRPLRMYGCTIDITQRREAEARIYDLLAEMRAADRRKDEFLATLAHELRNPLAPLRNSLEILNLAGVDSSLAARARSMMERQLAQMVRLIDDLLDVSRITHDKLELKKECVDLVALAELALKTCRPQVQNALQQLESALPLEPLYLDADPARVAQILGNLLANASKYTGPEGRIRLSVERSGSHAVVRVRDTGIGIRAELLPRVFDMFTQLAVPHGTVRGGLGIGLALVKRLVEMHEGEVVVHSDGPDRGTEFTVRLPARSAEPPAARTDAAAPPQRPPTTARRVLVVDDKFDAAMSLATLLEIHGNEVQTAQSGEEAIELARSYQPDVILLDIGLPGMDGYESCRAIRSAPWGKQICIMATTGWGQLEDRRRSAQAGFDHHLVKPLDPLALLRLIASLPARSTAPVTDAASAQTPVSR